MQWNWHSPALLEIDKSPSICRRLLSCATFETLYTVYSLFLISLSSFFRFFFLFSTSLLQNLNDFLIMLYETPNTSTLWLHYQSITSIRSIPSFGKSEIEKMRGWLIMWNRLQIELSTVETACFELVKSTPTYADHFLAVPKNWLAIFSRQSSLVMGYVDTFLCFPRVSR